MSWKVPVLRWSVFEKQRDRILWYGQCIRPKKSLGMAFGMLVMATSLILFMVWCEIRKRQIQPVLGQKNTCLGAKQKQTHTDRWWTKTPVDISKAKIQFSKSHPLGRNEAFSQMLAFSSTSNLGILGHDPKINWLLAMVQFVLIDSYDVLHIFLCIYRFAYSTYL